uniref:Uncharacterized protein n=1 Tax=uncultured marine virus TaxID=186617 RepID=A0A0F7LA24_9VIRU|nr:hypothetical protein [uncultured marine virus]
MMPCWDMENTLLSYPFSCWHLCHLASSCCGSNINCTSINLPRTTQEHSHPVYTQPSRGCYHVSSPV